MPRFPKAYDPQEGYRFQILCKQVTDKEYEHCDYATDAADKKHLLENYRLAYGIMYQFKTIELPQKYWKGKSQINKKTALSNFRLYNSDWIKQHKHDRVAVREAWNNYTDMLCKDGQITQEQYSTWDNPF